MPADAALPALFQDGPFHGAVFLFAARFSTHNFGSHVQHHVLHRKPVGKVFLKNGLLIRRQNGLRRYQPRRRYQAERPRLP